MIDFDDWFPFVIGAIIVTVVICAVLAIRYAIKHPCLKSHQETRYVPATMEYVPGIGTDGQTHLVLVSRPAHYEIINVCDERK